MAILRTAARSIAVALPSPLARFRDDVLAGLSGPTKTLPCKYLYDDRGSRLFDRICDLPEYYPTRTELSILRRHAGDMAASLGDECLVIEYGSGSGLKTPLLLERLRHPAGYVPVEISREHLLASAATLSRRFPNIEVSPVWADFTSEFSVPATRRVPRRRSVFFPGSTIGNFGPDEAIKLMQGVVRRCGPRGGFLVGVDLRKGTIAWRVPLGGTTPGGPSALGTPNLGGAITTAGGLTFIAATIDRTFRAFETRTGRELWQAALPAAGKATPMTYRANGRQFIVIAAGGDGAEFGTGDAIMAFALPDSSP